MNTVTTRTTYRLLTTDTIALLDLMGHWLVAFDPAGELSHASHDHYILPQSPHRTLHAALLGDALLKHSGAPDRRTMADGWLVILDAGDVITIDDLVMTDDETGLVWHVTGYVLPTASAVLAPDEADPTQYHVADAVHHNAPGAVQAGGFVFVDKAITCDEPASVGHSGTNGGQELDRDYMLSLLLSNRAVEFSPMAVTIADAQQPDMPLIYANAAFETITGYDARDIIDKNCRFLQGDDTDQPAIQIIRDAIRQQVPCIVTLRNYRRDGALFYNELHLNPLHDRSGRLTHFVGISSDVTDMVHSKQHIEAQNEQLTQTNHDLNVVRRQTEHASEKIRLQNEQLITANEALRQAHHRAEEATKLKSEFLATMSHELRTPLNAIIGYTEIQLAGMTGSINDEQRDFQQRVLANAENLLALINDVLDLSKIEAGRMDIIRKPFHLNTWLNDVVNQTQPLKHSDSVRFATYIDPVLPRYVVGDAARLNQVAVNLLSNAFKFTEQGRVEIRILKHNTRYWKVMVRDTGAGIPPHMQEIIFEAFRQVDSTSRRTKGGTGLGLSIVRRLTVMMGGQLRLKSQVGKGSLFVLYFPLDDVASHREEQHDAFHITTSDMPPVILQDMRDLADVTSDDEIT